MSATKYTYSIAADTASGLVNTDSLSSQIQASAIVIVLDYINSSGDVLDVWMKAALSGGDETILDSVVEAHLGVAPPDLAQPVVVSNFPAQVLGASGAPIVEQGHLTGVIGSKAVSIVSPNLGNRCTWYQKSVKVTAETLTNSGNDLLFTSVNPWWIDIYNPKLTYSHKQLPKRDASFGRHSDWAVLVYVDGVLQTSGYTLNYVNGTVTFAASKAGNTITTTYWHTNGVANCSEWLFSPAAGKKFIISCVELQYSMNMPATFDTIRFEVWGGAPLAQYSGNVAPTSTVSADSSICYPGIQPQRTTVSSDFTQPAAGATVTVTVESTTGMAPGQALFITGGGFYGIGAVLNATTLVLQNLGFGSFSDAVYDLGFGQFRADYRNVWDILNTANNQQSGIVPKHSDMQNDLFIAPYNYTQASVFDSALNATLRVCLKADTPIADIEIASATFYIQIV